MIHDIRKVIAHCDYYGCDQIVYLDVAGDWFRVRDMNPNAENWSFTDPDLHGRPTKCFCPDHLPI